MRGARDRLVGCGKHAIGQVLPLCLEITRSRRLVSIDQFDYAWIKFGYIGEELIAENMKFNSCD